MDECLARDVGGALYLVNESLEPDAECSSSQLPYSGCAGRGQHRSLKVNYPFPDARV